MLLRAHSLACIIYSMSSICAKLAPVSRMRLILFYIAYLFNWYSFDCLAVAKIATRDLHGYNWYFCRSPNDIHIRSEPFGYWFRLAPITKRTRYGVLQENPKIHFLNATKYLSTREVFEFKKKTRSGRKFSHPWMSLCIIVATGY